MKRPNGIQDISRGDEPLAHIELADQIPLPPPFDDPEMVPEFAPLKDTARETLTCLDDTVALNIPVPKSKEEEETLVNGFLSGFRKLFNVEDN